MRIADRWGKTIRLLGPLTGIVGWVFSSMRIRESLGATAGRTVGINDMDGQPGGLTRPTTSLGMVAVSSGAPGGSRLICRPEQLASRHFVDLGQHALEPRAVALP